MTLHPTPERLRFSSSRNAGAAARFTPAASLPAPVPTDNSASGAGRAFLQEQIDRLQARCDAQRGKAGYHAMLDRLRNARAAALIGGKHG